MTVDEQAVRARVEAYQRGDWLTAGELSAGALFRSLADDAVSLLADLDAAHLIIQEHQVSGDYEMGEANAERVWSKRYDALAQERDALRAEVARLRGALRRVAVPIRVTTRRNDVWWKCGCCGAEWPHPHEQRHAGCLAALVPPAAPPTEPQATFVTRCPIDGSEVVREEDWESPMPIASCTGDVEHEFGIEWNQDPATLCWTWTLRPLEPTPPQEAAHA